MLNTQDPGPKGRRLIALAGLILLGAGCSAFETTRRSAGESSERPRPERSPNSGATLSTDPATVDPGQTIGPPSLGVDLSNLCPVREELTSALSDLA